MYSEFWIGLDVGEYEKQMNNVRDLMETLETIYEGEAIAFVEELAQLWFSDAAYDFENKKNDFEFLLEPYSYTECLSNLPKLMSNMANAVYNAISKAADKVGTPNSVSIPEFDMLPVRAISFNQRFQKEDLHGGTGMGKELAKAALSNFTRICAYIKSAFDQIPTQYGWPEDNVTWYGYFDYRINNLKDTFQKIIDEVEKVVNAAIINEVDRVEYGEHLAEKIMGETEAIDKILSEANFNPDATATPEVEVTSEVTPEPTPEPTPEATPVSE